MFPTLLRNFDRASMRYGVEIRMPFLDWRLVEYTLNLPVSSLLNEGYTKKILRESMVGIMPDSVRLRKTKIGLNIPMQEWFISVLKNYILQEVHSCSFQSSSLWNGKKIEKFVDSRMENGWSLEDCCLFWPYLNAHILNKDLHD
jgi:asparagine synthase (glutamine-hydrolysing)